MVTQACTVSLRFWMTKRPFQSALGPSRLAMAGRYSRCEPGPGATVSPPIEKALPPRITSLARSATIGWSVEMTAEPWKPEGRTALPRWKKVQPLPGYIGGQVLDGQR